MTQLLLTFDSDDEMSKFKSLVDEAITLEQFQEKHDMFDVDFVASKIEEAKLDPPIKEDHERVAALFISGRKMSEGLLPEINKKFELEVGSHSASVEIKEMKNNKWVTIRRRMRNQLL